MVKLSKEIKTKIADYFETANLVDFLQLKIENIINTFKNNIEESLDDIENMMGVRHD